MRQGATFPKLVGLGYRLIYWGWEMSLCKGQAPEKGAAVSHHSQAPVAVGGAMPGGKRTVGAGAGMSAALTAALLPVWDNIITHRQHMLFCAGGQDLRLILLYALPPESG